MHTTYTFHYTLTGRLIKKWRHHVDDVVAVDEAIRLSAKFHCGVRMAAYLGAEQIGSVEAYHGKLEDFTVNTY